MTRQRVLGAILVGGRSVRMGTPKQLLELDGATLPERIAAALAPHTERVVLVGDGAVPAACTSMPQVADAPGVRGPLAGILGAMRWAPDAVWIVAACDQPRVRSEAIAWLLAQRTEEAWAVLPRDATGRVQPLLALWSGRARAHLEALAARGRAAPREFAAHARCLTPRVPPGLAECWRGVDRPQEYDAWVREERARPFRDPSAP